MKNFADYLSATAWEGAIPPVVDFFRLPVFQHFGGRNFHAQTLKGAWNMKKLAGDFASSLIRSDTYDDCSMTVAKEGVPRRLLIRLEEGVYAHADSSGDTSTLTLYAGDLVAIRRYFEALRPKYIKRQKRKPVFYVLKGNYPIKAEKVESSLLRRMSENSIELHYGDGFLEWEKQIVHSLQTNTSGAVVFRGEPGVGKTTFIRHLIARLGRTHRFFYLPATNYDLLCSPQMIDFWNRQHRNFPHFKLVIVIEDAETLLMKRAGDNRAKVANLLNIADGMLGEVLKMQLLCTVNCPMDELDAAVTRPGRMLAYRQFRRLDRREACLLASAKGLSLRDQTDYSLAEIYKSAQQAGHNGDKARIGFSA